MYTDELFIDDNLLPQPLTKEESCKLFNKINQGDISARNILIEHNIRLVIYEVKSKFNLINYDKKDLVSIGNIGLIKAVNTFDNSKGIKFSTYATKCIDNEILMFLKKNKKGQNIESLDKTINYDIEGDKCRLEDVLCDDTDFVEEYLENERCQIIRNQVDKLSERDRDFIFMHFGFYNGKIYTQNEIAEKHNVTQSYVSRQIKRTIEKLSNNIELLNIVQPTENIKDIGNKEKIKVYR